MAAKKKAAGKAACNVEWNRHRGGRVLVNVGTYVEVRRRNGTIEVLRIEPSADFQHDPADIWVHYGAGDDIMAWRRVRKPRADKGTKVAKVEPAPFTFDVGQKVRLCMPSWPTIDGKAVEVIGRRNKAGSENIYACTVPEGAGDLVIVHDGFLQVFESMLEAVIGETLEQTEAAAGLPDVRDNAPPMPNVKPAKVIVQDGCSVGKTTACPKCGDSGTRPPENDSEAMAGVQCECGAGFRIRSIPLALDKMLIDEVPDDELPPLAQRRGNAIILPPVKVTAFRVGEQVRIKWGDVEIYSEKGIVLDVLTGNDAQPNRYAVAIVDGPQVILDEPDLEPWSFDPPMDGVARDETSWRALTYILGGAMIITTLIQLANHFHWFE